MTSSAFSSISSIGSSSGSRCARSSRPAPASCRRARSSSAARCCAAARFAAGRRATRPRGSRTAAASGSAAACGARRGRSRADPTLDGVSERLRIRSATSSARFCAIASSSSDKPAPRVVVEAAEQAEVEEREPAVGREEDVPRVRVGVVHAFDDDLEDVRAEELARELACDFRRECVPRLDLLALDVLEHEHRSVTCGRITSGTTTRSYSSTSRAISSVLCASSTKSSSWRRCTSSSSASASTCRSCAVSECPRESPPSSAGRRGRARPVRRCPGGAP